MIKLQASKFHVAIYEIGNVNPGSIVDPAKVSRLEGKMDPIVNVAPFRQALGQLR